MKEWLAKNAGAVLRIAGILHLADGKESKELLSGETMQNAAEIGRYFYTPHMHFGFVPLTSENKLCAKEIINRPVLFRLQSEMPKFLQEKGFKIERGEAGSKAVHKSVKQYKADMEKEKAALAVSIQKEKQELSQLASIKAEIKSVEQIPIGKHCLAEKSLLTRRSTRRSLLLR